ncbi:DUF6037 family protein [Niallia taxi]|uniref:DUF6037 family protein n=1 Tax=Niallia taxi TaxID=2499688 RepID=UPI00300B4EC6
MMHLTSLKELHLSMIKEGVKSTRFEFVYNKAKFKCLFFTDENPFWLVLAIQGTDFYLKLDVLGGYRINTFIKQDSLNELKRILGIGNGSNPSFSTNEFFSKLNSKIPHKAVKGTKLYTFEIAEYLDYPNVSEGKYFKNWITHDGIKSNARPENLLKTRTLIGKEAYEMCKKKNVSSGWSDDEKYKYNMPTLPY